MTQARTETRAAIEMKQGAAPFAPAAPQEEPANRPVAATAPTTPERQFTFAADRLVRENCGALPALLEHKGSVVALTAGGRAVAETIDFRRDVLGQAVYVFDPLRQTEEKSVSLNALDLLDPAAPDFVRSAREMAGRIVQRYADTALAREALVNKGRPFMHRKQARHQIGAAVDLLTSAILYVRTQAPAKDANLAYLGKQFGLMQEGWRDFLGQMGQASATQEGILPANHLLPLYGGTDTMGQSVKHMVGSALAFARDPKMARRLGEDRKLDLPSFLKGQEPATLYIVLPQEIPQIEEAAPWVRALVSRAAQTAGPAQGGWLFLMDDFHKMGRVTMPEKAGVSLWAGAVSQEEVRWSHKPVAFVLKEGDSVQNFEGVRAPSDKGAAVLERVRRNLPVRAPTASLQ